MDTVFLCDQTQTELCISQATKVLQYARHLLPGGFHVKGGVHDDQYWMNTYNPEIREYKTPSKPVNNIKSRN